MKIFGIDRVRTITSLLIISLISTSLTLYLPVSFFDYLKLMGAKEVSANGLSVTDGLVFHLDATSIVGIDDGDKIAGWDDLSGEDNHATQGDINRRPVYKESEVNGRPVVRFDASSSLLATDSESLSISPHITVLAVAKPRITDAGARRILIKGHSNWGEPYYMYTLWNSGSNIGFGVTIANSRRWANYDGSVEAGNTYIFSGRYNGSNRQAYKDITQVGSDAQIGNMDTNGLPLIIGGTQQAPGNTWFDGDIGEILIYDRALSDAELREAQVYLGIKWLGWDIVMTMPAEDIGGNSTSLNGEILGMAGVESVKVFFNYRKNGDVLWQETNKETKFTSGTFNRLLSSLEEGTIYEFRAAMEADGDFYYGEVLTFTTQSALADSLVLHLDASSIEGLIDGDQIDEWRDISGWNNHVTQGEVSRQPLYKENGINDLPVVRFDASSSMLAPDTASLSISPHVTIIAVAKPRITDGGARRILIKGHSNWGEPYYMYTLWSSGSDIGFGVTVGATRRWSNYNAGIQAGSAYIWGGRYNGSRREAFLDGVLVGFNELGGAMNTNNEPLIIGATQEAPGITWFDGDIGEIRLYDRALSNTEMEEIKQVLGEKWLGWPPLENGGGEGFGLKSFSTIDGFSSFYVTGDVEVKSTPFLYNARENELKVSVKVKTSRTDNYNRNSIALYHNNEGNMELVDRVSTDNYLADNINAGGEIDNNFVFDISEETPLIDYAVNFRNAVNLNVSYTVSTFISI